MVIQVLAILAREEMSIPVLTLEETQDQQPLTQAELPVSLKTLDHARDPCPPTAEEWITQELAPQAALGRPRWRLRK